MSKVDARLGYEIKLENFTGTIRVKDRGWFIRLKNLFKPQKCLFVIKKEEGDYTVS